MVEFAITLPLLVLLFFGVYDLGRWLQLYMSANRVAYEGVRFASSIPGLDSSSFTNVEDRIAVLIQLNDLPDSTTMVGELPGPGNNNTVTVRIAAPFEPVFLPFEMRVKSMAVSPYLFSN